MAADDAQEKTEEPTERRREEARKRGQIVRSKELNTMALIFGGVITLYSLTGHIASNLQALFYRGFTIDRIEIFNLELFFARLDNLVTYGITLVLPFLIIIVIVALLASVAVGGFHFSIDAISFKWDRLDPINGIKKMFSWKAIMELVKAVVKFALIVGFFIAILHNKIAQIFLLDKATIYLAITSSVDILLYTGLILALALIIIAIIDVPFQFWHHARQLKMSKQELRDELKDSDGKPEVKSKIREKQRELRKRRMMANIPKANVIITNPTHFAVAIKYDDATMAAPVVVAKGVDLVAELIKKVAKAHNIPFVEAPPLARSLYYHVELEAEIPAGLYVAVAKILAYIYELQVYKSGGGEEPTQPREFPIPKELIS